MRSEIRRYALRAIDAEIDRLKTLRRDMNRKRKGNPKSKATRKKLSPAERQKISKRMKAYWASKNKSE